MEVDVSWVWRKFKCTPYREVIESRFPVSGYQEFLEEGFDGRRWVAAEHDR